jgi:hypothetical protein
MGSRMPIQIFAKTRSLVLVKTRIEDQGSSATFFATHSRLPGTLSKTERIAGKLSTRRNWNESPEAASESWSWLVLGLRSLLSYKALSAMSIAKVQHYVPQFLLKHFGTGKKDKIAVFNKQTDRVFATNVRNVAAESRFYDFTAADKNLACLFEAPPAIELAIRFVGPVDKVNG